MHAKLGLLIAIVVFITDLATKWFIVAVVMNPSRTIEILPFFNLVLTFNRGISFGLFASDSPAAQYFLSLIALVIVGVLFAWLRRSGRIFEAVGIGSIIGGALANVVDRLENGAVTDFLDFHLNSYHWPAFNVADTAIFLGVVCLVVPTRFGGARNI